MSAWISDLSVCSSATSAPTVITSLVFPTFSGSVDTRNVIRLKCNLLGFEGRKSRRRYLDLINAWRDIPDFIRSAIVGYGRDRITRRVILDRHGCANDGRLLWVRHVSDKVAVQNLAKSHPAQQA